MAALLRLLAFLLLVVKRCQAIASHEPWMPVEPDYPIGGPVGPGNDPKLPVDPNYSLLGFLCPPRWHRIPNNNRGVCESWLPAEPKYPIGDPVSPGKPMFPAEPKFPIQDPMRPGKLPMLPVAPNYQLWGILCPPWWPKIPTHQHICGPWFPPEPKYPTGDPMSPGKPPVFPPEPKYPTGDPVSPGKPPVFPPEPKYPTGDPASPGKPPVFPPEPKYPTGDPVSPGKPPVFPPEPKYPVRPGNLSMLPVAPNYQLCPPWWPKIPTQQSVCDPWFRTAESKYPIRDPVSPSTPPVFPAEPNYPIEAPVRPGKLPMLPVAPNYPLWGFLCSQRWPSTPVYKGICDPWFPVESKYPVGDSGPGKLPLFPAEPKYPLRDPGSPGKLPLFPAEPKYPLRDLGSPGKLPFPGDSKFPQEGSVSNPLAQPCCSSGHPLGSPLVQKNTFQFPVQFKYLSGHDKTPEKPKNPKSGCFGKWLLLPAPKKKC